MITAFRDLLDVLFASLWQDAIVGICAAAAVYALGKRVNAATRHVALQAVLFAMIVVPAATTLPHIAPGTVVESGNGSAVAGAVTTAGHAAAGLGLQRIDVMLSDRLVVVIAALWLAGALAFLLRIALGMAQLARIVRGSERLADRGGARIYASPTIPVPVAFGLLRPAIVIPAGIVKSGGEELECVLLHELAHVRRHDAWLHTFERLVHAVLFFNPAVALLLHSISLERESACDDWAVAHSHDASTYTHSLAALAVRTGIGADAPAACGAMGSGHEIVDRIERLQDQRRNRSLLLSPFALGGFAFMLVSIALSLQLLAPAVAFSGQTAVTQPAVASSNCTRFVSITYPVPPPVPLPAGAVDVKVLVSPTGTVTSATIAKSSGNAALDRAVLKVARENGYTPAMRDCKPIAGAYLFRLTSPGVK